MTGHTSARTNTITCPVCGCGSRIILSIPDSPEMLRKRRCIECGYIFFTIEQDCDEERAQEIIRKYWREYEIKRRRERK